jgi:restriction endonuclease
MLIVTGTDIAEVEGQMQRQIEALRTNAPVREPGKGPFLTEDGLAFLALTPELARECRAFYHSRAYLFLALGFKEVRDAGGVAEAHQRLSDKFGVGDMTEAVLSDLQPATPNVGERFLALRWKDNSWWALRSVPLIASQHFDLIAMPEFGWIDTGSEDVLNINRRGLHPPQTFPFLNFLESLRRNMLTHASSEEKIFWRRWDANVAKETQAKRSSALSSGRRLIEEIQKQKLSLEKLHWKDLEEIVAEVLRGEGLDVTRQRSHPQGGRDLVVTGRFGSGALFHVAVEVKHKTTVDGPEIHQILYQNRRFNSLLVVTSGSFTAGVYAERANPDNNMRLILRDGIALRNVLTGFGGSLL